MESTISKIIEYIEFKKQVTASELSNYLGISRQAVHRQLNNLQKENIVYKVGRAPKVFYLLSEEKKPTDVVHIDHELKKIINDNFLAITPSGEREEGFFGFIYWCNKQKLPIEKTALEYGQTIVVDPILCM